MSNKIYTVNLAEAEQEHLENMISSGVEKARKLTRARILLKAHQNWTDKQISEALDVNVTTVKRIREKYKTKGLEEALNRKASTRQYERKIDGKNEAHLIALVCSTPPAGQAKWSMRLLAERFVKLEQVEIESISHETVRQVLKKNELKPWQNKQWIIPAQANAAYVFCMEDVLNLYHLPYNSLYPLVCFDESNKQLISELKTPLPIKPGLVARYDYQYERQGVCNLFMFFEPLSAWRHVEVTDQRTKIDFAHCMKYLVDVRYPDALKIRLVMDNLNTHQPSSLYDAFPPQEARRLLDHLEFHYTPIHASWLNMAEIELSILSRQCLDRRIPDKQTITSEISAWEAIRNQSHSTINWRFTTADARIKLRKLYPTFDA